MHANLKNLLGKYGKAALVCSLPLLAASCTVSEPDAFSGKGGGGTLESITFMNQRLFYFSYDAQGRLTEINSPFSDDKITISYNPLKMVMEEYEDVWYNGDDKYMVKERTEWSNMQTNAAGYVTSFDATETVYDYNGSGVTTRVDTYSMSARYDSSNHIIYMSDPDGVRPYTFKWKNGCLDSCVMSEDGEYIFGYSDIDNTTLAWTPMWGDPAIIFSTGLFGVGPEKMVRSVSYNDYGYYISMEFAYKLNSAGQISALKYCSSDEDLVMTLLYNYR